MSEDKFGRDVAVFLKIMDRGFHLSVPIEQERYFRNGYQFFQESVQKYKERDHDEIEAIALTAIDCVVALQRSRDMLDEQKDKMEASIDEWSAKLESALLKE